MPAAFTHSASKFPCSKPHAPTHKGTNTPRQQHYTCIAPSMSSHVANSQSSTQRQQSIMGTQTSFASSSAISSTFNPLFKVLFMFPSWYLFAIGFTLISSLGWKLPPALRSNSKERDSWNASRIQRTTQLRQACHLPRNPFPKHLHVRLCWDSIWRKQFKVINLNFHARLIPVHSPLLKNSHLVSHPPLTYMLKFSRLLCLMSCSCGSPGKSVHNNASSKLHALRQRCLTQQALRLDAQSSCSHKNTSPLKHKEHWHKHALRNAPRALLRSMVNWFTEFCNSQWLLHFAAPFINMWTKTSVAEIIHFTKGVA